MKILIVSVSGLLSLLALSCASLRSGADVISPFRTGSGPGGSVMVIRSGSVVFADAFGCADAEAGVKNTPATNFRLASVTKQFTAMSVMILAERGALSLDQTLQHFFPDFAPVARTITLRHLLTHTSGLLEYEDVMPDSTTVPVLDADVLRLLKGIDSTRFPPGTRFAYSNSAFALLALIVERTSGMPFARFLEENIFRPLHMDASVAYEQGKSVVAHRAFGYSPDTLHAGAFVRTDQSMTSSVLGDGGIYSSVLDLSKWDEGLAACRLVPPGRMREVYAHQALTDDGKTWYGYGWFIGGVGGVEVFYHGGSTVGFRTCILRMPARSLTVLVLCNRADIPAEDVARQLAQVYM
jgi:CubicO group peptidase (beta-lactamase class C family)